jgi:hypothetical protein
LDCPDRRIDRHCNVLFAPSNLHITPGIRRDLGYAASLCRKRDGFLVTLAPSHHRPDHPASATALPEFHRRLPIKSPASFLHIAAEGA